MVKECTQLIRWKHAYGPSKDLVSEKEEIKCNNMKNRKMIKFDDVRKENIK